MSQYYIHLMQHIWAADRHSIGSFEFYPVPSRERLTQRHLSRPMCWVFSGETSRSASSKAVGAAVAGAAVVASVVGAGS